jgi:hypothetical protein
MTTIKSSSQASTAFDRLAEHGSDGLSVQDTE